MKEYRIRQIDNEGTLRNAMTYECGYSTAVYSTRNEAQEIIAKYTQNWKKLKESGRFNSKDCDLAEWKKAMPMYVIVSREVTEWSVDDEE